MRTSFSLHSQRKQRAQRTVAAAAPVVVPSSPPNNLSPPTYDEKPSTMSTASTMSTRVLRSLSVPCNLPVMAENFMQAVEATIREESKVEQEQGRLQLISLQAQAIKTSIGSNDGNSTMKGFLPQLIADSMRSEDDYFLPFDDDNTIPEEEPAINPTATTTNDDAPPPPSPPLQPKEKQQPPMTGRDVAVAALGEFFLCESPATHAVQCSTPLHTSPVSTIEINRELSLEHHNDSQVSAFKSTSIPMLMSESVSSDSFQGNDSLTSVLEKESEDGDGIDAAAAAIPETVEAGRSPRRFIKLSHANRTNSLPLDFTPTYPSVVNASPPRLTRRSSLKKVSSYGKFPPSKSSDSLKRNVSFGNMKIREYKVALSDHPSCSYGPPIQLAWEYREKEEVPLDSYEASREGNRRQGHSLLLSFYERHFMLIKQAGYSKREIKQCMKEVERVKRERQVTDLFLAASPIDETMEHVMDTVKQFFRRPKESDKNYDASQFRKEAVV